MSDLEEEMSSQAVGKNHNRKALSDLFDEDDEEIESQNLPNNNDPTPGSDVEMTDAQQAAAEEDQEEDDIFGDGAGDEDDDDIDGADNVAETGYYDYGENDDVSRDNPNEDDFEEVEMQEMEIKMPRRLPRHKPVTEHSTLRVPNFLNVEFAAYESEQVLQQLSAGEGETAELKQRLRAQLQNTLRWRYAVDDNSKFQLQSNARIIRWSDGSLSLKLGSEIFDINEKTVEDTYLAVPHEAQEIVQFVGKVSRSMTLVPTSMSSTTHLRLSSAIAKGQVKVRNVHDIATTEDPEKMKREAEKAEETKIRARKKLENKRKQQQGNYLYSRGGGISGGQSGDRLGDDGDGMGYGQADAYERDDFVVSDEDEEEERAARLRKVKKQGSEKYKSRRKDNEEDDEDEEEEEEEDGEEEEEEEEAEFTDDELEIPKRVQDRKRRRQAEHDEDDRDEDD